MSVIWNSIKNLNACISKNFVMSHCLETKLKHNEMGTLQLYILGYQNDPSYPKQKEILKYYEGNLEIRDNSSFGIFTSEKYTHNHLEPSYGSHCPALPE